MAVITINTTQNVSIDYEVAGLGIRIGAFFVDLLVIVVSYFFLAILLVNGEILVGDEAIFLVGPLFYTIAYFFFSEMLSRGRTPGKRLLKLRVIRMDGRDPTPADFLTRAVFHLLDSLLTLGMLAILLILVMEPPRRLGDLVAGTVVIHTNRFGGVSLADILTIRNREDHETTYPAVQRFTDEDMLIVKECLLRYRRYNNEAHREAVRLLAQRMGKLLELPAGEIPTLTKKQVDFLQRLLLDYIVLTR